MLQYHGSVGTNSKACIQVLTLLYTTYKELTPFGKVIVLVQQQLTKYKGHIESYHV